MLSQLLQLFYLFIAVFSAIVGVYVTRYRDRRGGKPLSVMLFAAAGWSGTLFLQTITGPVWTGNLYSVIGFFGAVGSVATLLFALDYCGYHEYITKRRLFALAVYPLSVAVVSFVNPWGLFFTRGYTADTLVGYHHDLGPLFAVHVSFGYLLLLTAITIIFAFLVRFSRRMFRGQAVALFVGNLAPLLAGLPPAIGYIELDVTPIGFFVATTAYAVAVTRYRLADLTPVGRDQVLDSLQNGVVVVDTNDRVIDYNDAALALLNEPRSEDPTGKPIRELFGRQTTLATVYEEAQSEAVSGPYLDGGGEPNESSCVREVEIEQASLQICISRLEAGHPIEERTVITLEDISLQKRRERQLRQQVEQLDQFTSIVSHDLRNPLSVAAGYVEQAEQTGDTTHLSQSKEALERMDGLIEDMLTVAKQSQNAIEPVSVSVREAATAAWENVETEQMTLDVRGDCTILADPGPFAQLLENLYRNAREHGFPDADTGADSELADLTVCVDIETHPGSTVSLTVSDDGVGLPDDPSADIFDRSYTTGGNGLGLMIVRQIANTHGWSVSAENSDSGGAEFRFTHIQRHDTDAPAEQVPSHPASETD